MEFNGTFLASIISFVVFVFLMNKILYNPIEKIVEERQKYINQNNRTARQNFYKAQDISEQHDEKLVDAKSDARSSYNETVNAFKEQGAGIIKNSQTVNKEELERAYENLKNISNEAKEGLKMRVKELADDIVEKVIGYRSEIQNIDYDTINEILYREGK